MQTATGPIINSDEWVETVDNIMWEVTMWLPGFTSFHQFLMRSRSTLPLCLADEAQHARVLTAFYFTG